MVEERYQTTFQVAERYQTTYQLAERYGVTAASVSRWCREGRLAGVVKHAGGWYIPRGAKLKKPTVTKLKKPTVIKLKKPTVAKLKKPTQRKAAAAARTGGFDYETAPEVAARLGVSTGYVIRLIRRGLLPGERGEWACYAIPRGAEPIISLEERRSRRPEVLRSWRQLRSEKRREILVLQ